MIEPERFKVSVVIPVYNAEGTVEEALDSVDAQSFRDMEIIIVDDASTDSTPEVVDEWRRAHEGLMVHVIRMDTNAGPAAARNRAVSVARGEWVAFLDADDCWCPGRLDTGLRVAEARPDAALVCGARVPLEAHDDVPPDAGNVGKDIGDVAIEEFVMGNPIVTSTVLVRRAVIDELGGFDEQFRGPEDYDLWMRLAASHTIVKGREPFVRYRRTASSLSMNDRVFLPELLRVLDKAYAPDGVLRGVGRKQKSQAYQVLGCAWASATRGDFLRSVRLFGWSLMLWPWPFGPRRNGRSWERTKLMAAIARATIHRHDCAVL